MSVYTVVTILFIMGLLQGMIAKQAEGRRLAVALYLTGSAVAILGMLLRFVPLSLLSLIIHVLLFVNNYRVYMSYR